MSAPNVDNTRSKLRTAVNVWLAIFAVSSGIAGAGLCFFVVPWSAKGWESIEAELPAALAHLVANHMLYGLLCLVCGIAATTILFVFPKGAVRLMLVMVLSLFPALIAVTGIVSWWLAYIGTINRLSGG